MRLMRISPRTAHIRSRLRREEGASLVEFAISLGIFLAVTLGIMLLCMALYTYEYVDFASREATRWASVRGADCSSSSSMPGCGADKTAIQTYVQKLNYPIVNPSNVTVDVTWLSANGTNPQTWSTCGTSPSGGCDDRGNEVQVTVNYPYLLDIPFAGSHNFTINSTTTLVISQ